MAVTKHHRKRTVLIPLIVVASVTVVVTVILITRAAVDTAISNSRAETLEQQRYIDLTSAFDAALPVLSDKLGIPVSAWKTSKYCDRAEGNMLECQNEAELSLPLSSAPAISRLKANLDIFGSSLILDTSTIANYNTRAPLGTSAIYELPQYASGTDHTDDLHCFINVDQGAANFNPDGPHSVIFDCIGHPQKPQYGQPVN